MLEELHLENLGIIESLDVLFSAGLNVVTGETGAGKTLIVDAIELLVGGRADSSMIRAGAEEARVDGVFVDSEGNEVVISRVVPRTGRSRAYINGRPTTVSAVAEACRELVELHGQHAHQSLLSPARQRELLDAFGSIDLHVLNEARADLAGIEAEMYSLGGDERERARQIDLLRHQVNELDTAALQDRDEDEHLAAAEALLADAVAHREAAAEALELLNGEGKARDAAAMARQRLDDRRPFVELAERLDSVLAELDELISEVREAVDTIEEDPAELDRLRTRRHLLADLRRKYGRDLAEVMAFAAEARHELATLEGYDERVRQLATRRQSAIERLDTAARAVGSARAAVAPALCEQAVAALGELALAHARLEYVVGSDDPAGDRAEFWFSANPGSPTLPLARVASGGELARVMLALRRSLLEQAGTLGSATLVFDEVDAGLGGSAAKAVGTSLAGVAQRHQVMVVTHLAQVAACADRQLVVHKETGPAGVRVQVVPVSGEERLDELARMLAGSVTEAARGHAAELLG